MPKTSEKVLRWLPICVNDNLAPSFEVSSVSGHLLEVDRSAKEVSETMTESSATASSGDAAAQQAMAEIKKLLESSHQITGVLETVQDLAFQTNLLSINASIEAARVGEVGAGFAVVATEVRLLAERSRESAETVEQKNYRHSKNHHLSRKHARRYLRLSPPHRGAC